MTTILHHISSSASPLGSLRQILGDQPQNWGVSGGWMKRRNLSLKKVPISWRTTTLWPETLDCAIHIYVWHRRLQNELRKVFLCNQGQQTFPIKGRMINILDLVSHRVSWAVFQLGHCHTKVASENWQTHGCGWLCSVNLLCRNRQQRDVLSLWVTWPTPVTCL